jgi:hypothetical protein
MEREPATAGRESIELVYQQTCESYRAIDDFRAKLLGFLPFASGGAALLTTVADLPDRGRALACIGALGFVITLGLFAYEVYGIKRCHHLIEYGRRLELDMKVSHGQFEWRPHEVARRVAEPFASALIYPAVLAGWCFLGFSGLLPLLGVVIGSAAFCIGVRMMLKYDSALREEAGEWRRSIPGPASGD